MRHSDLLAQLASRHGVATRYTSQSGEDIEVDTATITYTLRALGVDVSDTPDDAELTALLYADYLQRSSQPLPTCVVATEGQEKHFPVHVHHGAPAHVHIELEGGGRREVYQDENDAPPADVAGQAWGEATFHTPGDLPLGFHRLLLDSPGIGKHCTHLIVTPARLRTADAYLDSPAAGVMAQLYSVRSRNSWGLGDFSDLGLLAEQLAADADFLLINPLHAAEPEAPVEDSPYLPTSRRFLNPLYLDIHAVPELKLLPAAERADVEELAAEFRERNRSAETINRDEIFSAKLHVLRQVYRRPFDPARRAAFVDYCRAQGPDLERFARWCARRTQSAEAGFYSWLQFLCSEQLAAAQERATRAGMRIGLMTDLAVGVHPAGADAEVLADFLAPQCSVGAPPDDYNQLGQDWSQPPWHPVRLAEAGYRPWRDLVAASLRHAGGLRIDHILGLFRLFWIPRQSDPSAGTYVSYDFEAMIGIVLLEAERAGAVVVGEDLGTLEPWVQQVLADKSVLGTSIVWFERDGESPLPQEGYRRLSLSSVGTHDLPPTLGYLRGEHLALRARLGLLSRDVAEEAAADAEWQERVLAHVGGAGEETEALVRLHEFIAGTGSALTCTSLVDAVGDTRAQNQPGTTRESYPNWCIPLCDAAGHPVLIEDLGEHPLARRVLGAAARRG